MREIDIHKLIEQQEPEAKQRIWEKISSQVDLTSDARASKKSAVNRKFCMWTALATVLVCIVTLSIVLPLTLGGGNDDNYADVGNDDPRYSDTGDYLGEPLGQTLKEYSEEHNLNLLYIDRHEAADEVTTEYGYHKSNKDKILYLRERITNGETNNRIILYVTDTETKLDIFESHYGANESFVVGNTTILWNIVNVEYIYAMFEHGDYTYYLRINNTSVDFLTETVESMLK